MTPKEKQVIEQFAAGRKVELVEYKPEKWAEPNRCINNAQQKVGQSSGSVATGFIFCRQCSDALTAVPHAIWQSPEGQLIDITPIPEAAKQKGYYDVSLDGKLLFVPCETIFVINLETGNKEVIGIRLLCLNPKSKKMVAQFNRDFYEEEQAIRRMSIPYPAELLSA